ncbi:beta-lactamase-like protein, partial [mine drainage metagenome]
QAGEALRRTAEELTGHAVRYVVLTHRDYDHVIGAQSFPQAVVISTATTDAVIRRRVGSVLAAGAEELAQAVADMERQVAAAETPALRREREGFLADFRALVGAHATLAPHYPDVLFERSLTLQGPRRRVDVHSFGAVHTESDGVVFLPEEGILFCGDIVQ